MGFGEFGQLEENSPFDNGTYVSIPVTTSKQPEVDLMTGIERYLDWIRTQTDVREYFAEAENLLRTKGIVHKVNTS